MLVSQKVCEGLARESRGAVEVAVLTVGVAGNEAPPICTSEAAALLAAAAAAALLGACRQARLVPDLHAARRYRCSVRCMSSALSGHHAAASTTAPITRPSRTHRPEEGAVTLRRNVRVTHQMK